MSAWCLLRILFPREWKRVQSRLQILLADYELSPIQVFRENWRCFRANLRALSHSDECLDKLIIQDPEGFWDAMMRTKVVLVGAHQGCFELMPRLLARQGLHCEVPVHTRALWARIWLWLRQRKVQAQTHYLTEKQCMSRYRIWTRHGGRIALLADQGQSEHYGRILGETSPLNLGLVKKLRHYRWNIIFFRIVLHDQGFQLDWSELPFQDSLTISYAKFLEESILTEPLQWVWHYPLHWPHLPQYLHREKKYLPENIE